jgi:LacI family transcriptional regulator
MKNIINKNKRTTLKDVAKATGFSTTSVSLVLNNKKNRIAEESKSLIKRIAKEMNYRPNQMAVSLVQQRTKTIGLVISDISNLFFANLTKGIENDCKALGYNVILCNSNDNFDYCLESINILLDRKVDGLILGLTVDTDLEKAKICEDLLKSYNTPFITVDRFYEELKCPAVIVDNELGGYLATNYLIKEGHKEIGFISGPNYLHCAKLRFEGYKKALKENNIEIKENYIVEGNYSQESGVVAFNKLKNEKITAMFISNGAMAIGAYRQALKSKVKIPDEISIVSYDDHYYMDLLDVPLTTIKQPIYEMGKAAANKIISLINNENKIDNEYTVLTPKLIIRNSVKEITSK